MNLKQHPWQVGWEGSIPVGGRLLFCSGDPEVASVPAAPPSHNNRDPPISSRKFSNRGPHKLPAVGSCCSLKSKHRQPPLCVQHLLLFISKNENMLKHQYGSKVRVLRVMQNVCENNIFFHSSGTVFRDTELSLAPPPVHRVWSLVCQWHFWMYNRRLTLSRIQKNLNPTKMVKRSL